MNRMIRWLTRRGALAALAVPALLAVSVLPAAADQLVVFKNGKAMLVKSTSRDGKWLKCQFEDKNFISVPASTVLAVEEATQGSSAGEYRPNQVATGSGGAYVPPPRPGDGGPPPEIQQQADAQVPEDDPSIGLEEERAYQRQKAMELQSAAARRGNNRGIPFTPGQNQPGVQSPVAFPGGLQPLNQAGTPFQNRRTNSRRLFSNDTQQPQNSNQ